jgi:hypothetical protein
MCEEQELQAKTEVESGTQHGKHRSQQPQRNVSYLHLLLFLAGSA